MADGAEITVGEAWRTAKEAIRRLDRHEQECGERYGVVDNRLTAIEGHLSEDKGARQERQIQVDQREKSRDRKLAVLGLLLAAPGVLLVIMELVKT